MPTRKKRADGTTTYFGIEEIVDKAKDFLKMCDDKQIAPTTVEFEKYLGVSHSYILDLPQSHSASVNKINKMFENYHAQKGLQGEYNTPFHIFYMKNKFKWSDRQEVNQNNTNVNKVIREVPESPED